MSEINGIIRQFERLLMSTHNIFKEEESEFIAKIIFKPQERKVEVKHKIMGNIVKFKVKKEKSINSIYSEDLKYSDFIWSTSEKSKLIIHDEGLLISDCIANIKDDIYVCACFNVLDIVEYIKEPIIQQPKRIDTSESAKFRFL